MMAETGRYLSLAWHSRVAFEDGRGRPIDCYLENTQLVEDIQNDTYMDYYRKQYGEKMHESKP